MWLARSPLLHPFLSPLLPPSWLAKYEITNKQIKQKLTTQPQIKHAPDNSLLSAPRPALPRSARPCRHRWLRRSLRHLRPPGTAPGPQPPFEGAARGPDTRQGARFKPKGASFSFCGALPRASADLEVPLQRPWVLVCSGGENKQARKECPRVSGLGTFSAEPYFQREIAVCQGSGETK